MTFETRQDLVLHACRWANTILVEVLANYARSVSDEGSNKLRQVSSLLEEAQREFRMATPKVKK